MTPERETNQRRRPTKEELVWIVTAHPQEIIKRNLLCQSIRTLPLFVVIYEDVENDPDQEKYLKPQIDYRGQA